MKFRRFFWIFIPFMSGCEITASFFVEKQWVTGSPWDESHPDLKTRASIDVKIPTGKDQGKSK